MPASKKRTFAQTQLTDYDFMRRVRKINEDEQQTDYEWLVEQCSSKKLVLIPKP